MSDVLFTGASRYSSDFQSIIDRAVRIASLPMMQIQSASERLRAESTALDTLNSKISSLKTALSGVGAALSGRSFMTTISDASILSATVSDAAREGMFEIEVTRLGSYENWLSRGNGVTDPASVMQNIAASGSFTLTVGAKSYQIDGVTSLNDLVEKINRTAGSDVQASALNVRTLARDDYRLSIQSRKLGDQTITLTAGEPNLLETEVTPGTTATYKINGVPAESDSRTVALAPGVTATLTGQSETGKKTSLGVSRSSTAVVDALNGLAAAYNGVIDEIDKHHGDKKGALSGNSLLYVIAGTLRNVAGYSTAGQLPAQYGIELDDRGRMLINSAKFTESTRQGLSGFVSWLGSEDDGGFLGGASDLIDVLQNSDTGFLALSMEQTRSGIDAQDERVATEQKRIDELIVSLQERFSAADALIASLEQQAGYVTNLFQSMRAAQESLG
jgi:flagellar capping protein FliD